MKLPPELEAKLGKLNEVTIDADLADLKQQAEGWARAEGVVEGVVEGDDEIKVEDLVPVKELDKLRAKLAKAAQKVYDNWELDEDGYDFEVGEGGICHLIADAFLDVLPHEIPATTISSDHEVHVWVAILTEDGVFRLDIPHGLYETGGGYNWKKIPDVKFEANDIIIDGIAQVEDWKDYDDDDS